MKNSLRKEMKAKREGLHKEYVERKSYEISQNFLNSRFYKESSVIMSYVSIKNEVLTEYINKKIISDGKKLILPYINDKDEIEPIFIKNLEELISGKYGIPEPSDKGEIVKSSKIDLIIVPAVVYDKFGNRIGFGKGYYDKFLKKFKRNLVVNKINNCFEEKSCEVEKPYFVGFAYDFQVVEEIESEEHDIGMDYIFTNVIIKK